MSTSITTNYPTENQILELDQQKDLKSILLDELQELQDEITLGPCREEFTDVIMDFDPIDLF